MEADDRVDAEGTTGRARPVVNHGLTFYHRAIWLERLTGIEWIWLAEPVQQWLPGIPTYVIVDEFPQ